MLLATPRPRRAALGALTLVLASCSGDSSSPTSPGQNPGTGQNPTPSQLVFAVQPADVVAGASFASPIRVEIRDASGKVVTSATGSVALALSTNPVQATLDGTTTVNAVAGIATFSSISIAKAAAGYQLTASSGSLISSPSAVFNVAPGVAAKLVFIDQPPEQVEANFPISPRVRVAIQDALGNLTAAAAPVTLSLAESPWSRTTLSGTLSAALTSGSASFADLRVDRPGPGYVLRATAGSLTTTSRPFAVRVSFYMVAAGGWNANYDGVSCGIASGGTFCWGSHDDGQLGAPNAGSPELVPILVRTPAVFVELSAGGSHVCGRTQVGAVYCWGRGTEGQLGNGSTASSVEPVLVSGTGPGGLVVESISAGHHHTCALVTGRSAYCWGENRFGEIGDGSATLRSVPAKVSGSGAGALQFASISAGSWFTCGSTTAFAVWCWGEGSGGRLGSSISQSASPVQVIGTGSGTLRIDVVSAGLGHACGVTVPPDAGKVYCWGVNTYGGLGNGSTQSSSVPVLASAPELFSAVEVGTDFTCGLSISNTAYCWGRNFSGEVGSGSPANFVTTPTSIAAPPGVRFRAISAGGMHGCAVANVNAATGDVYCWGMNDDGRLGDGTSDGRRSPVRVVQ
jgi:alpha-tubulin suppressor-like RCC1 family protein